MKNGILTIVLVLLSLSSFSQTPFENHRRWNEEHEFPQSSTRIITDSVSISGLYSFSVNDSSLYTQEYLDYCNQFILDTIYQDGKVYKYISYDKPNDTTWSKLKYSEWKDDFTQSLSFNSGNYIIWDEPQYYFSGTVVELKEIEDRYYWVVVVDIINPVEVWRKREKASTSGFYDFGFKFSSHETI